MLRLFISYAAKDCQYATRIHNILIRDWTHIVESCFFAPISLPPGSKWENSILEEIRGINVLLVLWSEHSKCAYGQILEVGAAWALEKRVIVLLLDYDSNLLPFILRDAQAIEWGNFNEGFQRFISLFDNRT